MSHRILIVPLMVVLLGVAPHSLPSAPPGGSGGFGYAAQSSQPWKPPDPDLTMTKDEAARAQPLADEGDARWKVRLAASEFDRKHNLLGRPSRYAITDNYVCTPFERFVLDRDLSMGRPWIKMHPIGKVDQIVKSQTAGAFTFEADETPSSAEIALVSYWGTHRLKGHKFAPWKLLFSPDGSQLVSCSEDESTRLWDVAKAKQIAKFPGYGTGHFLNHGPRGNFVAFSPDNKWLATIYVDKVLYDDKVTIRRASDGKVEAVWEPNVRDVPLLPGSIRFSADGKSLFAFGFGNSEKKSVKFLQFVIEGYNSGERRFEGTRAAMDGLVTPDGKYVITWSLREQSTYTYERGVGKEPKVVTVYSGTTDVSIWNIERRKEVKVFKAAPEHVYDVALSPTGSTLATAGDDNVVKFWDVATGRQRECKMRYRHEGVDSVQFSPDGRYLITANDGGPIGDARDQTRDAVDWLKVWDAPRFAWVSAPGVGEPSPCD